MHMYCRSRDHFVYASSQWETLQCNVASHWLGAYTKWFQPHRMGHGQHLNLTRRSENDDTPQPLDQWTNSPFIGQQVGNWSICHALWPIRKPIVHPTLYPTHISFIPSQSNFPFPKKMAIKNLTLKIQGQGQGWGQSFKSQLGSNILSDNVGNSHRSASPRSTTASYGFISLYVNPPSYSYDRAFF